MGQADYTTAFLVVGYTIPALVTAPRPAVPKPFLALVIKPRHTHSPWLVLHMQTSRPQSVGVLVKAIGK